MDLSRYTDPIQMKLAQMEPRERYLTIAGSIIVFIMLLYLLIWDPIMSGHTEQQEQYQANTQLLSWMQQAAEEAAGYQSAGPQLSGALRNQSISSLASISATSTGVKNAITKLESKNDEVNAELKNANFNQVINWIDNMQSRYAIYASKVKIEPNDKPGAVDVRLSLHRNL